ncbi:unnamed protein product, partial [Meganyctiphanes norvegica]
ARDLESPRTQWLVLAEIDYSYKLEGRLREGTQVGMIVSEMENDSVDEFKLLSSRVNSDGVVRFLDAGLWRPDVSMYSNVFIPDLDDVYTNLDGRLMTMVGNMDPPFITFIRQLDSPYVITQTGMDLSIIHAISVKLNFTYRMIEPPDRAWGGPRADGTVSGLIGVIARHEANFGIGEITLTGVRDTVVDFTFPNIVDPCIIVQQTPKARNRAAAVFW